MNQFKLSELLEKTGLSFEEASEKLKEIGVDVSSENSMVSEQSVKHLGVDTSSLSFDRRQEMLKKAMERHKKYSRAKEVVVKGSENDNTRKISKEDLLKKKMDLEKKLRKVDDERQKIRKDKEINEKNIKESVDKESLSKIQETKIEIKQVPSEEIPQDLVSDKKTVLEDSSKIFKTEPDDKSEKNDLKSEHSKPDYQKKTQETSQNTDSKSQRVNRPRSEKDDKMYVSQNRYPSQQKEPGSRTDRTGTDRPRTDGSATDRPTYNRTQGSRPSQGLQNRPAGDSTTRKPPYGTSQNTSDRPSRPAGQGRDFRKDRPQQAGQPESAQGERRPFVKKDGTNVRTDNRTKSQFPWKKEFEVETEDSFDSLIKPEIDLKVDEKKKKDTEKVELEAKKAKAKKGVKKEKNIVKNILEGIDELELEQKIVKGENVDEDLVAPETEELELKEEQKTDKFKRQFKGKKRERSKEKYKPVPVKITNVDIGENIVLNELAGLFGIKAVELVKKLFNRGIVATVNQSIDAETAQLLGAEYGIEVNVKTVTEEDLLPKYVQDPAKLVMRPPIVTVMGHVDHGKTSLLDAIRKTDVAEGEAGGITQHIGAYEVNLSGRSITFLDTPGHEAFTTLRARGANVTDIVILVVAADDGVMPQTKEAIDHAKAAGVRIVVAINKIDKPNANPDKVKTQLADYGIIPDEWGGEYQFQEISAKNRIGIEDLLERVLLEADVLELKADPDRLGEGIIIESKLDKQKGPVATVLVKEGTIKNGDFFVVGSTFGKVRAMFDYKGKILKSAGPAAPVEVMGFSSVPYSGENIIVLPNEKIARQIAELRLLKQKETELKNKSKISLTDIFGRIKDGQIKELNIIVKGDVQGSVEALKSSFAKLSSIEVKVNVIHDGVGGINESDVLLASASNAIIIGFNVRPDNNAKSVAEREEVEINLYSVIYEAIDDVKKAIGGLLSPEVKENILGKVQVRQVFSVPKIGKIAGGYVLEGKIVRNGKVRVIRDNVVVYEGVVGSLKRFADDAKEVLAGYECGVGIDKFNDIKENDIFEVFELVEHKRDFSDIK